MSSAINGGMMQLLQRTFEMGQESDRACRLWVNTGSLEVSQCLPVCPRRRTSDPALMSTRPSSVLHLFPFHARPPAVPAGTATRRAGGAGRSTSRSCAGLPRSATAAALAWVLGVARTQCRRPGGLRRSTPVADLDLRPSRGSCVRSRFVLHG